MDEELGDVYLVLRGAGKRDGEITDGTVTVFRAPDKVIENVRGGSSSGGGTPPGGGPGGPAEELRIYRVTAVEELVLEPARLRPREDEVEDA